MYKYKLLIAYDGTFYGGWQVQPNASSIQAIIQKALQIALRSPLPLSLTAAGRTDAGVHARGQVAHFQTEKELDLFRLLGSLNGLLPYDIRILSIEPASPSFHARYDAVAKRYTYYIHLNRIMDPFLRRFSAHIPFSIDLDLLDQGRTLFIGTHDFTSFSNECHRIGSKKSPIRTLHALDLHPEPGGIRLEFLGNGFLYKMVRNIVGTLLEVGCKKIALKQIPEIFAAKDRRRAGPAASPEGLFLTEVIYK